MLLPDALDRNERDRAQTHAAEIEKRADAGFDDDLLVLEARSRTGTVNHILDKIKQRATEKPRDAVSLAYWLIAHRLADDAATWLEKSYQLSSAPVSLHGARRCARRSGEMGRA